MITRLKTLSVIVAVLILIVLVVALITYTEIKGDPFEETENYMDNNFYVTTYHKKDGKSETKTFKDYKEFIHPDLLKADTSQPIGATLLSVDCDKFYQKYEKELKANRKKDETEKKKEELLYSLINKQLGTLYSVTNEIVLKLENISSDFIDVVRFISTDEDIIRFEVPIPNRFFSNTDNKLRIETNYINLCVSSSFFMGSEYGKHHKIDPEDTRENIRLLLEFDIYNSPATLTFDIMVLTENGSYVAYGFDDKKEDGNTTDKLDPILFKNPKDAILVQMNIIGESNIVRSREEKDENGGAPVIPRSFVVNTYGNGWLWAYINKPGIYSLDKNPLNDPLENPITGNELVYADQYFNASHGRISKNISENDYKASDRQRDLSFLLERSILSYDITSYSSDFITRKDALRAIMRINDIEDLSVDDKSGFRDVTDDDKVFQKANTMKIVIGVDIPKSNYFASFEPERPITKKEMYVMAKKYLVYYNSHYSDTEIAQTPSENENDSPDTIDFEKEVKEALDYLREYNIIFPENESNINGNISLDEYVYILSRIVYDCHEKSYIEKYEG